MAYILSAAGSSNPVLTVKVAGSSDTGLAVPFLQDVTINNSQDIFTWTQLNVAGKLNVPTTSTNSLDSTVVVDLEAFFGDYTTAATEPTITVGSGPGETPAGTVYYNSTSGTWFTATLGATPWVETSALLVPVEKQGLLNASKNKVKVEFDINVGDPLVDGKNISGEGYVTGLSPTVSADSPVWTTPLTITVDGDYTVA